MSEKGGMQPVASQGSTFKGSSRVSTSTSGVNVQDCRGFTRPVHAMMIDSLVAGKMAGTGQAQAETARRAAERQTKRGNVKDFMSR